MKFLTTLRQFNPNTGIIRRKFPAWKDKYIQMDNNGDLQVIIDTNNSYPFDYVTTDIKADDWEIALKPEIARERYQNALQKFKNGEKPKVNKIVAKLNAMGYNCEREGKTWAVWSDKLKPGVTAVYDRLRDIDMDMPV